MRSNLKRQLNSSADLRALLLLFAITATVFSALPLLRYFRGRTLFDYELWYETGQHVLAGHEIYFFRSGKYDFMYPPPCALFLAGASLLGQGGLILLLVAINSAAWFYSARLSALLAGGDNGARNVWLYLVPSLSALLDSGSQSCRDAGVFSSHFACAIPRFWTSMARYRKVECGNAQI